MPVSSSKLVMLGGALGLAVVLSLPMTTRLAAQEPKPGRWEVVAHLDAIDITQRHMATLHPELCGDGLLLKPDNKPEMRLQKTESGAYIGESKAGDCTTVWRLNPGRTDMSGRYKGQCPQGSMAARVTLRRSGPLPEDFDDGMKRAEAPDVPDDWLPEMEEQGDIPPAQAVETVEAVLAAAAGQGVGAARSLSGYVWPNINRGRTDVSVWLTADKVPRRHQSLIESPCDDANGQKPEALLEPARYMLHFKNFRYEDGHHEVFAQLIDVETGKIQKQSKATGPQGQTGLMMAVRTAFSDLGVDVSLP